MDFITKAAPYIAMGWKVFPIVLGKRNLFSKTDRDGNLRYPEFGDKGSFYWGSNNPVWMERFQRDLGADCNIAVATGEVSGIIVIDLDFGKSPAAHDTVHEALQRLAAQGKVFPKTPGVVVTPSGGEHWYYRYRGPLRNSVGKLGAAPGQPSNIDIRANGGMIILPPTVREDGTYRWVSEPFGQILPPVPRWLMEEMRPPPPTRTFRRPPQSFGNDLDRIQWRLDAIRTAPEGQRNDTLYRKYAQCLDYGHAPRQVAAHFEQAALDAGLEPQRSEALCARPSGRRTGETSHREGEDETHHPSTD